MARTRAWLLIALFVGVAIAWTASAATGRLFDTYAYFFDAASDTGNTITADILQPPSGLTATNPTTSTIDLAWTASPDAYATGYEIFRRVPPAGYGGTATYTRTEAQVNCVTPGDTSCTFQDTGLNDNTQYCYQVRAAYLAWVSPFSSEACATTQQAGPPPTSLFLNSNLTLTTSAASTGNVNIAGSGANSTRTWSYAPAVGTQTTLAEFTLRIVQGSNPSQDNGAPITITVFVGNSTCSSTVKTLATSSVVVPRVLTTSPGISFTLTPTQTHTFASGERLCLRIENTAGNAGAPHSVDVQTGVTSASGITGIQSSLLLQLISP